MIYDHIEGFQAPIDPSPDNPPPEPPVYKTVNNGLHFGLSVITAGFWGVFVWAPLHYSVKNRNKRNAEKYRAQLSQYRHDAYQQRYGRRKP
jgi:hypothetical protein